MAQRWQPGSPSSFDGAAQPSSRRGGAEQPTFTQLPDDTSELTVGFYNVGIQLQMVRGKHWPQKEQTLKQDIVKAFDVHALDVLCLSALGQLNESLDQGLEESAGTSIKSLISAEESSGMRSSAAQPALASEAGGMMEFTIHADDHYAVSYTHLTLPTKRIV